MRLRSPRQIPIDSLWSLSYNQGISFHGVIVMALFDNLGKKVGNLAQATAKKSGEVIEVTKLNMNINSEEDGIKKAFLEMGGICYKLFEENALQQEQLIPLCTQVQVRKAKIVELRQRINTARGIKICPNCGAEIELTTPFCSKCGSKQETATQGTASPESEGPVCPACNAKLTPGTAFCSSCGAKIG